MLFYLQSRGISAAHARGLLTWAFANELLQKVPDAAARGAALERLAPRLGGAAGLDGGLA
jgi:Fe-S cluster assembly protein SufD